MLLTELIFLLTTIHFLKSILIYTLFLSLIDLTGGVCELIDVNRMIREQKKLATIRHNSSTIIRMINRAGLVGSIRLASMDSSPADSSRATSSGKVLVKSKLLRSQFKNNQIYLTRLKN